MRYLCVYLILIVTISCGKKHNHFDKKIIHSNIVSGEEVTVNEFENVVALLLDNKSFCTGTLIDEKTILTAAHCIDLLAKLFIERSEESMLAMTIIERSLGISDQLEILTRYYSAQEVAKLEDYFKQSLLDFYDNTLNIYIGSGNVGGIYKEDEYFKLDISRFEIHPLYFQYLFSSIFKDFHFVSKAISNDKKQHHDLAKIHLNNKIEGIVSIPLATQEELEEELKKKNRKFIVVGFGKRETEKTLNLYQRDLKRLTDQYNKDIENYNDNILKFLIPRPRSERYLINFKSRYDENIEFVKNEGMKAQTELTLKRFTEKRITLTSEIESDLGYSAISQGACHGDSGGPAFLYFEKEKQYKQIGVTTHTFDECLYYTYITRITF